MQVSLLFQSSDSNDTEPFQCNAHSSMYVTFKNVDIKAELAG